MDVLDGDTRLQTDALGWLARLPFLGAEELALLLGTTKLRATAALRALDALGWVEWVRASSPELDQERLHVLTPGGRARLAERSGVAREGLEETFPVKRRELLERLTRLEITVGFNRFAAELAAAVREDQEVELLEIRSLPLWRPPHAWWPPAVEGYGCLRRGRWRAPFFVAWDRAGAPPFHRRKRVSAWYAFREGDHAWGRDDIPPVLVVCAGEAEADQWVRAVLAACDRRQTSPLPVFIAHVIPTLFESPLGPVWRRPEGTTRARLCERLTWRSAVPAVAGRDTALSLDEEAEAIPSRGLPLREWAVRAVETLAAAGSGVERLAALALATAPGEKRALEWLGHHPLLSTEELAVALGVWEPLAARLLERLDRYGLARFTQKAVEGEATPTRRHYLTSLGLKLLAARDGVPPRRYARYGVVAASTPKKQGGGRLQTLLRQLDHTVGVNRFFVRLIADGAKDGPRLIRWLSASEAAQRFTYGEVTHWLRPDGAGDISWRGEVRRFYLEWDRGTVKLPDLMEKCRLYAAYYASLARRQVDDRSLPYVLAVTTSPLRENILWSVRRGQGVPSPLLHHDRHHCRTCRASRHCVANAGIPRTGHLVRFRRAECMNRLVAAIRPRQVNPRE